MLDASPDSEFPEKGPMSLADAFDALANEFQNLEARIDSLPLVQGGDRMEIRVMLRMEAALCRLEAASHQPPARREQLLGPVLQAYLSIFDDLEAHAAASWSHRYRVMALYRCAHLRERKGQIDDAIELCEQTYAVIMNLISSNGEEHIDHKNLIEIALYYIWLLQERAERAAINAESEGNKGYRRDMRLGDYRRMTEVALDCITKFDGQHEELLDAALFGAAEHAALGQPVWEKGSVTAQQIADLRTRFDLDARLASGKPDAMHTAFRAAEHVFHDLGATRRAAIALERCLSDLSARDEYQERDLQQVLKWLRANP